MHVRKIVLMRKYNTAHDCYNSFFKTALCVQELDSQEAAAADLISSRSSANVLGIIGSSPRTYSNECMFAVHEHQLVTGVSNNKAAQVHALIVLGTC